MQSGEQIQQQIFTIKTTDDFNRVALEVFKYQVQANSVYKTYVSNLPVDITNINHYLQIPCLPIGFFKTRQVVCGELSVEAVKFTSSGTTGAVQSAHYVNDIKLYEASFLKAFELFYGNVRDYCILALLPNYLEREGSSLVYMFDELIRSSQHPLSGFYLHDLPALVKTINLLKQQKQKVLLLGVTYALLDLAETGIALTDEFIVMETGGMKGKRKEMIKEELHAVLKNKLSINAVHSEYGMTELLSQAYSKQDGLLNCPPWMRVLIRDVNDPFHYQPQQKSGGVNVIDLANLYSCSFIETKDLGKINADQSFEIIGRFDNSDIRGCNLMIQ